jgi:ATP-binding cassette, subfamily C (CFTR/MRP), member 4
VDGKNWPKDGKLTFNSVFMRYNKDLNHVLKGVTFEILPGEKIGCIGRTGAGKSSILQVINYH